jgi:sugar phosphate isomerase/epimerase
MLTRRNLLAAAGSLLPVTAAPKAAIGLGFRLYGMPALERGEALRATAELGYDDAELELRPGWKTEPQTLTSAARGELRAIVRSTGLSVPALGENLTLDVSDATHADNLDHLRRAAELAYDLDPARPPLIQTTMGGNTLEWERRSKHMAERLAAWARVAEECRITLAVKAHAGAAADRPERCLWLLDAVGSPRIRATYDYSHFQVIGLTLAETLAAMLPRAALIHVKDSAGEAPRHKFLLPGEGTIDYTDYFRRLARAGYRGSVQVEVSADVRRKPGYDAVSAARQSYRFLAPLLDGTGVRRQKVITP